MTKLINIQNVLPHLTSVINLIIAGGFIGSFSVIGLLEYLFLNYSMKTCFRLQQASGPLGFINRFIPLIILVHLFKTYSAVSGYFNMRGQQKAAS